MGRQRIGKLKWTDFWVINWSVCIALLVFALWVLVFHYQELPKEVRFVYLIISCFIFMLLFVKMKTVLEYDGEFIYVISIHFFMRFMSCKIKENEITNVQFVPYFWYKWTAIELAQHYYSKLPYHERTIGNFLALNLKDMRRYYRNHVISNVCDAVTYSKVCIIARGRKIQFVVKRDDEVFAFVRGLEGKQK